MPELTMDDRTLKKLKKLKNGQVASFYFTCNTSLDDAALVARRTSRLGKDTTKALGAAARKERGLNKFCRGMILRRDSGELVFVSYGGNVPPARLQKLMRLQLAGAFPAIKGHLKAAVVEPLSAIKQADAEELARLGLQADGTADTARADEREPEEVDEVEPEEDGASMEDDIRSELVEMIAEVQRDWEAARGTPREADAARALAESISSGEELFPTDGDAPADARMLADLYDLVIRMWAAETEATAPTRARPPLFLRSEEDNHVWEDELRFRGQGWWVIVFQTFPEIGTWNGAALEVYSGEQTDALDELCESIQDELDKRLDALAERRKLLGDAGAQQEISTWLSEQVKIIDDTVHAQLSAIAGRTPQRALSSRQLDELDELLLELTRLGNALTAEQIGLDEHTARLPPVSTSDMPEYAVDAISDEDLESLTSIHRLQRELFTGIATTTSGDFKLYCSSSARYPDLLCKRGDKAIRLKKRSEMLKAFGYKAEQITGKFDRNPANRSNFLFTTAEPLPGIMRVSAAFSAFGNQATFISTEAQMTEYVTRGRPIDSADLTLSKEQTQPLRDRLASMPKPPQLEEDATVEEMLESLAKAPIVQLMLDPDYGDAFLGFCRRGFNIENALFVIATLPELAPLRPRQPELMAMLACGGTERVRWIFRNFIQKDDARWEINITGGLRASLTELINSPTPPISVTQTYVLAASAVLSLLSTDVLSRFKRAPL